MKTLWQRLRATTPAFWRRVQLLCLGLLATTKVLQADADSVPAVWRPLLPYAFTVLTTITVTAQFTCADASRARRPTTDDH
ncbi:hypothetical protein [Hymenobacter sp. CRA2]|uniref:hypothetical protein n=1 Tax=Hymenobacter sp. CRA2 TaxID=1955620 RepID=UPI00099014A2|nr:hypothetical protein [Hymenobacter sp. CRA2]OON67817.1 hypothetical protein B0919_16665 [Hymenobacter sp. CRA2]